MRYPLASTTWGQEEVSAIADVLKSGCFTMGDRVREFESRFADYFGARYAIMVNSGSSANLLAVASLRYRSKNTLEPGDEVIVPAVSWSTTYFPLHQYGLKLRFVDVDLETLNLDLDAVERAVNERTRAVFAVNLLGAPNDFGRLRGICERHKLILLEDNCEAMGALYDGKYTGTFGLCGAFSMFFSHHICTMEGGVVATDDPELAQIITCLRAHGWTRELASENYVHNKDGDAFRDMYRFVLPGYNVRPLEISAAAGLCQLDKLDSILAARRSNADRFTELFDNLEWARIQKPSGLSSWFGFALILEGPLAGRRDEVVRRLADSGVECRPIVAGDFTKNPVIRFFDYEVEGALPNAGKVDRDGLFIGNHPHDISEELSAVKSLLSDFATKRSAPTRA
jgi:CDP-6-deoxy-D-xylo-4-hexulose-3-dehydrase